MPFEPWQWILGALSAFLIGLSKTGISGLGMFAVVIFASILPTHQLVGVVLAILLVGDIIAVTIYRRETHWGHLLRLFPWAAVGVVAGAVTASRFADNSLRILIGGIVVTLSIMQIVRSMRPTSTALPHWVVPPVGLLAGFTTMVANAAGPLMVIYLLAMSLPKLIFVGTAAWFFFVLNIFKVPFSYGLGQISPDSLTLSLLLAPFTILGAISGRRLITNLDQRHFEGIALGLSLIAGLRLLI